MIVELISDGKLIRLPASQLVVFNDEGTPVSVSGEFGPRAIKTAHALDADFQATLKAFGVGRHNVEVEEIKMSPVPGGALLVAGPGGN